MIRVRIRIALFALLVLGVFPVACHRNARVQSNADVGPVIKDTTGVVAPITDPGVVALFRDTGVVSVFSAEGQTFKLQTPGQRQSLHATLRKERELWRARKPRDYKFLLRVECFCPGSRRWLLIEVRSSRQRRRGPDRFRPALAFSYVRPYRRAARTGRLVYYRSARVAADLTHRCRRSPSNPTLFIRARCQARCCLRSPSMPCETSHSSLHGYQSLVMMNSGAPSNS